MRFVVFYRGNLVAAFVHESDATSYVENCSDDFEFPYMLVCEKCAYVVMM